MFVVFGSEEAMDLPRSGARTRWLGLDWHEVLWAMMPIRRIRDNEGSDSEREIYRRWDSRLDCTD